MALGIGSRIKIKRTKHEEKMNMFEYAKTILKKVSFDKGIFQREYKKFIRMLSDNESKKLQEWQKSNFKITINENNSKTKDNRNEEL